MLSRLIFYCLLLGVSLGLSEGLAQPRPLYDELDTLLWQAEEHVTRQEYKKAVRLYTRLLSTNEVIPASMCHFFSVALHHLGRHQEAKRFAEAYLAQVPPEAPYYEQAQRLSQTVTQEMEKAQSCSLCDEEGKRKTTHLTCQGQGFIKEECPNCHGHREVICALCYEQGLLIRTDAFGKRLYLPCPRCDGTGKEPCTVCQRTGYLQKSCAGCRGDGKVDSEERCTHIVE